MSLCKNGQILNCCHPNALMTLKEYLEDYATPKTKEIGDELIKAELEKISARHSQNTFAVESAQPVSQKAPAAYGATAPAPAKKASSTPAQSDNEIIRQLQQRVEGLEAEIRMMKRKQMIKTIIELGAPIAMLILLLIVFFASGLYDSIQQIIGMAGI